MKTWTVVFGLVLAACGVHASAAPTRVHVFVALADNATQGISPVPAKIGNGDDAESNLYWGASEGFRSIFARSKSWRLEKAEANPTLQILDRRIYRNAAKDCTLVAEAWRGKNIHQCLEAFFNSLRDRKCDLTAFIGHNGLMDEPVAVSVLGAEAPPTDAIILCCVSGSYFKPHLAALKTRPVLTTEQLMYPGAFVLRDALDVWLSKGTLSEIRMSAARAYAANQGISVKAAAGVFSKLE
ncbi:hypothetical protein [Prosthecobacter vanneervenii]|uniref:Uncharacterized protein n=1 Tax=Prosthecobacter vanneervenii TaxID=48466 RepID=A0A7W8DMC9_9BACT|nr:hypothetical protein [Prosthecobacter vanneervenii]MBB5034791.1 hypothetical protein [Prosthecobacter vanneervenii]